MCENLLRNKRVCDSGFKNVCWSFTDLVAVQWSLQFGGASGHTADGDRQQRLHQQRQSARVLDRLHTHLQPPGVTLLGQIPIIQCQNAAFSTALSKC